MLLNTSNAGWGLFLYFALIYGLSQLSRRKGKVEICDPDEEGDETSMDGHLLREKVWKLTQS